MFNMLFVMNLLKKIEIDQKSYVEAKELAKKMRIPVGDALHAIIARNNNAVLVSQDHHFKRLKDIISVKRPEEII